MAELSDQEMLRYNRQIILRGFDFDGQEALKDSRVLVVGLGGLGCAASQYLASAGVGNLTLLDFDTVSLSNLQRQTLHSDATVGQPKVESARDALARINPHIAITPVNALLDDAELAAMIAKGQKILRLLVAWSASRRRFSPRLCVMNNYWQRARKGQPSSTIAVRHWMKNRKWAPWGPWRWI